MNETIECERRNCDGELTDAGADPALPPHVRKLECAACGEWYDLDTEDGTIEVDA